MNSILAKEEKRIINFIRQTLKKEGFKKLVLGLSGGVDSSTVAFLAAKAVGQENLHVYLLPYNNQDLTPAKQVLDKLKIMSHNVVRINITDSVNSFGLKSDKIRLGNVMARVRMIILFDAAKRLNALVCGTENRSEQLLGYFTRFGDSASDIEPIQHLYKTQVYQLAKYLGVPNSIIKTTPTAGFWPGQTDEGEFDFTYKQADEILYLYFDKKKKPASPVGGLKRNKIVDKVLGRVKNNLFKHRAPYSLSPLPF